MSYPTVLSPWYVVQKFKSLAQLGQMYYYTAQEEDGDSFLEDAQRAVLFMSLHSAVRVAEAEGAEIRVLTSKDDVKEFRRD